MKALVDESGGRVCFHSVCASVPVPSPKFDLCASLALQIRNKSSPAQSDPHYIQTNIQISKHSELPFTRTGLENCHTFWRRVHSGINVDDREGVKEKIHYAILQTYSFPDLVSGHPLNHVYLLNFSSSFKPAVLAAQC